MKIIILLIGVLFTYNVQAQMFYDMGGHSARKYNDAEFFVEDKKETKQEKTEGTTFAGKKTGYEAVIGEGVRREIRISDAAYIYGEPDEVLCFSVRRKSPKVRQPTLNGYEHVGNCGSLNEEGMKEIQGNLFKDDGYSLGMMKPSDCVSSPKLLLRFRKGYDFADLFLSGDGDSCPVVTFMYAGESKDLYANRNKEWLKNFITAVSSNIELLETAKKDSGSLFRARKVDPQEEEAGQVEQPVEQKVWGRRFN